MVDCGGEYRLVGPELLASALLVGFAHYFDGIKGFTLLVFLLVDLTVTEHLGKHMRGKGVDTTHTYAMETTAHLVGTFVELTAGMEHGHHHLKGRLVQFLVLVDGDASAVVLHGDGVVFIDGYLDVGAVACHRLIDGVVYGFIYQVVKTFLADIADIHGGAFPYGLQAFKHLDVFR